MIGEDGIASEEAYKKDLAYLKEKVEPHHEHFFLDIVSLYTTPDAISLLARCSIERLLAFSVYGNDKLWQLCGELLNCLRC